MTPAYLLALLREHLLVNLPLGLLGDSLCFMLFRSMRRRRSRPKEG